VCITYRKQRSFGAFGHDESATSCPMVRHIIDLTCQKGFEASSRRLDVSFLFKGCSDLASISIKEFDSAFFNKWRMILK